jgi:hypothetical protein
MKIIKISLAIIVVGFIAFFATNSLVFPNEQEVIPPAKNQFSESIEKEIMSLSKLPVNSFCKDAYIEVQFHIEDYYKQKRLGKNQLENNQSKVRFSKNLYTVYTDKFVNQVYFVFNKSEWRLEDLNFIRNECSSLKRSEFLEKGRPTDKSLSDIQLILNKYDEINNFIASCKAFSYSDDNIDSTYPISGVIKKSSRASAYKTNKLENNYVNHCSRLHNQLNEIPKYLFNAHIKYLDKKINMWSGMYIEYNSHGEYARELYFKIKREIDLLDNRAYRISNFDNEYNRLINKLNIDNSKAKKYFK